MPHYDFMFHSMGEFAEAHKLEITK
jgi:hypothetical protein